MPPETGFGVDKVAVTFPAEPRDKRLAPVGGRRLVIEGDGRRSLWWEGLTVGPAAVDVRAREVEPGRFYAHVEFNPSRVLDPGGVSLCAVDQVVELVGRAVETSEAVLAPRVAEVDAATVSRVDLARDFLEVESPEFFIHGLRGVRRPYARRAFTYSDPARGNAETFFVGGKRNGVRLYDKHCEKPVSTRPGHVRWESVCRKDWLRPLGHVRVVGDVGDGAGLLSLAENRWRWSAMGAEVVALGRVIEKVRRSGESPALQRAFLGFLLERSYGGRSPVAKATGARFNRLQRDLNIVVTSEMFERSAGFTARLDWDSGREVIEVA